MGVIMNKPKSSLSLKRHFEEWTIYLIHALCIHQDLYSLSNKTFYREFSKPRDMGFVWYDRFEMWNYWENVDYAIHYDTNLLDPMGFSY